MLRTRSSTGTIDDWSFRHRRDCSKLKNVEFSDENRCRVSLLVPYYSFCHFTGICMFFGQQLCPHRLPGISKITVWPIAVFLLPLNPITGKTMAARKIAEYIHGRPIQETPLIWDSDDLHSWNHGKHMKSFWVLLNRSYWQQGDSSSSQWILPALVWCFPHASPCHSPDLIFG